MTCGRLQCFDGTEMGTGPVCYVFNGGGRMQAAGSAGVVINPLRGASVIRVPAMCDLGALS